MLVILLPLGSKNDIQHMLARKGWHCFSDPIFQFNFDSICALRLLAFVGYFWCLHVFCKTNASTYLFLYYSSSPI